MQYIHLLQTLPRQKILKALKHLVGSSLPGGHLEMDGVLVVWRETGRNDLPEVGGLELVGL